MHQYFNEWFEHHSVFHPRHPSGFSLLSMCAPRAAKVTSDLAQVLEAQMTEASILDESLSKPRQP